MMIQDMLSTQFGVLHVLKVEVLGGQHRIELLEEEEREKERLRSKLSTTVF